MGSKVEQIWLIRSKMGKHFVIFTRGHHQSPAVVPAVAHVAVGVKEEVVEGGE